MESTNDVGFNNLSSPQYNINQNAEGYNGGQNPYAQPDAQLAANPAPAYNVGEPESEDEKVEAKDAEAPIVEQVEQQIAGTVPPIQVDEQAEKEDVEKQMEQDLEIDTPPTESSEDSPADSSLGGSGAPPPQASDTGSDSSSAGRTPSPSQTQIPTGNSYLSEFQDNYYVVDADASAEMEDAQVETELPDGRTVISTPRKIEGGGEDEGMEEIDTGAIAATLAERRAANTATLNSHVNSNAGKIAEITATNSQYLSQISIAISTARSSIQSAEVAALGKLETARTSAKETAKSSYDGALQSLKGQFESSQTEITTAFQPAITGLNEEKLKAKADRIQLEKDILQRGYEIFQEEANNILKAGTDLGRTAMQRAVEYSNQQTAPEDSDYGRKVAEARKDACIQVGEQYQTEFNEKAATESKNLLSGYQELKTQIIQEMVKVDQAMTDEHLRLLEQARTSKAEANKKLIELYNTNKDALKEQYDAHIEAIDGIYESKQAQIVSTAAQLRSSIESTGASLKERVSGMVANCTQTLSNINSKLANSAADVELLDAAQFEQYINGINGSFSGQAEALKAQIQSVAEGGIAGLESKGSGGATQINELGQAASDEITDASTKFTTDINKSSSDAVNDIKELSSSFAKEMTDIVSDARSAYAEIISGTRTGFNDGFVKIHAKLKETTTAFINDLTAKLGDMTADMDSAAKEAGDKVPKSSWRGWLKTAISIVVAILVVVAVGLLATVTGGIFLVLGAILIGVIAGVLKQVVFNAIDGNELTKDLGRAAIEGAIDGATALIGGAASGALTRRLGQEGIKYLSREGAKVFAREVLIEATVDTLVGNSLKNIIGNRFETGEWDLSVWNKDILQNFATNIFANSVAKGLDAQFGDSLRSSLASGMESVGLGSFLKPEFQTPRMDVPGGNGSGSGGGNNVNMKPPAEGSTSSKPSDGGSSQNSTNNSTTSRPATEASPSSTQKPATETSSPSNSTRPSGDTQNTTPKTEGTDGNTTRQETPDNNNSTRTETPASEVPSTTTRPKSETNNPEVKPETETNTPRPETTTKPPEETSVKPAETEAQNTQPKSEGEGATPKPETAEAAPPKEQLMLPEPKPVTAEAPTKVEPETGGRTPATTKPRPKSASAQKAEDLGLPSLNPKNGDPPLYRYNTSENGTLYVQRVRTHDAAGNELPVPKIEGNRLKWPPVESYMKQTEIDGHLARFDDGGGYFVPKDALNNYGRDVVGRPDGQFITTRAEMDAIMKEAAGDIAKLERLLGIPEGAWQGREIARVDIDGAALKDAQIRMATGNESGANEQWIPGGRTDGGTNEAVVNAIPKGSYTETLAFMPKLPNGEVAQFPVLKGDYVAFKGDEGNVHFEKHSQSVMNALNRSDYNMRDYLMDANHTIKQGQFLPELNGYVRLIGGSGSGKFAFVGLDRSTGNITTFHIKTASEIARKAPNFLQH